jgi:hypothetical protein
MKTAKEFCEFRDSEAAMDAHFADLFQRMKEYAAAGRELKTCWHERISDKQEQYLLSKGFKLEKNYYPKTVKVRNGFLRRLFTKQEFREERRGYSFESHVKVTACCEKEST